MYIFKNEVKEEVEKNPCVFLNAIIKIDNGSKLDRKIATKEGTEPFTEEEIKKAIDNSQFLAWLRKTGDTPIILKTYQTQGTLWTEKKLDDKKELKEEKEDFILNFEPFEEPLREGRYSDLTSKLDNKERELRNLKVKLQNAPTSQAKDDIEIAIDKCQNDITNIQGELTEIRYLNGGTHLLDYEESLNEAKKDDEEFILNFEPFEEALNEDTDENNNIQKEIENNKEEIKKLKNEIKILNSEFSSNYPYEDYYYAYGEKRDLYIKERNKVSEKTKKIWNKIFELRDLNDKLEKDIIANKSVKNIEELADEDDWKECLEKLPKQFEFEDLNIRVEDEWESGPYSGTHSYDAIFYTGHSYGTLNEYTMTIEPTKELVSEYLKKAEKEITRKDLIYILEDKYYSFVYDKFYDKAKEEAEKAWYEGEIEKSKIDWDEPEEDD